MKKSIQGIAIAAFLLVSSTIAGAADTWGTIADIWLSNNGASITIQVTPNAGGSNIFLTITKANYSDFGIYRQLHAQLLEAATNTRKVLFSYHSSNEIVTIRSNYSGILN